MRTRIHYATSTGGARIAYATHGSGLPIVCMPPLPLRHLELEWQLPEDRRWLERLNPGRKLIRYDPRGLGLSERRIDDFSLEAFVGDLVAVVDAVGDARVVLFAGMNSAPIAIAYALRYPARVSHLILWCAVSRVMDALSPQLATLLALADKDWDLFTETMAHQMVGWSAGEAAHRYAEYLRACLAPEVAAPMFAAFATIDVTDLLPALRVPTLVLHRRSIASLPVARATDLASRIPGARLTLLDGDLIRPGVGDIEGAMAAIDDFLGDIAAAAPAVADRAPASQAFRREGDFWTLAFAGRVCRVRDMKGLHHLVRLLREPGRAFAPAALLAEVDAAVVDTSNPAPEVLRAATLGDAGAVLDAAAKADYRRRLAELRGELDDAERCNDPARIATARHEIECLTGELAAAVGLGGRDRKLASGAERARLTVTKRIRDALARIESHHPALARHLTATIKTGRLCSYETADAPSSPWVF